MATIKVSDLALLALLAALLTGGQTTVQIGQQEAEYGVVQVTGPADHWVRLINETLDDLHASVLVEPNSPVRYPGEGALHTRRENQWLSISVDEAILFSVLAASSATASNSAANSSASRSITGILLRER